jgi:4,5-dihydroxyphthalate decarboxylase
VTKLHMSLAAVNYDRLRALEDGQIQPEGIDLNFISLPVEETFYRQLKYQEFDACEMSLSSYILTLNEPDPPFIALPVFPSRYFRHQTMFVNSRSGIEKPADLKGKRVGVPEYQITAGVWQRGMLQDEYGVSPEDMRFYSGGVENPGRAEKIKLDLPAGIHLEPIRPDQTLSGMLVEGELDALFTAHVPSAFYEHEHIRRLFTDYKDIEQQYFTETGIFPIMHVLVLKRTLYDRHPWLAASLMKACEEALQIARADLMYRSSLKIMLPWLAHHLEETQRVMGEDYWPYGIKPNRKVLETFLRYSHSQGLAKKLWNPDEVFARNVGSSYVI